MFGVWESSPDVSEARLGPEWARSMLRLGWRKLYPAFTRVETTRAIFRWEAIYCQVVEALKNAVIAWAVGLRTKAAHSRFTPKAQQIEPEEAARYKELVTLTDGARHWQLTAHLTEEIARAEAALNRRLSDERARAAEQKAARDKRAGPTDKTQYLRRLRSKPNEGV